MKAFKILVAVLLSTVAFTSVDAQTVVHLRSKRTVMVRHNQHAIIKKRLAAHHNN